jgi:hypothetical protein
MSRRPRRRNLFWFLCLLWRVVKWAWRWSPLPGPTEPPSEEAIQLFYQSLPWRKLSRETRDKWPYCLCCGVTEDSEKLVADHIKPLRRYWSLRLDPGNMQVLCEPCNLNKGSHSTADFRRLARPA